MGAKVKVRAARPVWPNSQAAVREPIRIKGLSGRDEAPLELRTGHRKGDAKGWACPPEETTMLKPLAALTALIATTALTIIGG
ncbi:hypothetical protein GCM10007857_12570 [Bradyrhizobium iriomotense]|uniref:Uncharacterized protein n=1 Tax=Bradyrhizobium iriomotense TaxID=441950 RepID=A0ABQ6AQM3_9BRAD|nr:hypothetical protein GCM10007857_12570 [Bradyrhizobium iriomotense]